MYQFFILLHVFISICLILVVLMQSGKGGGVAGALGGGGGSQTVFGGRGATDFLGKATWGLGAGFMTTSLLLGVLAANRSEPTSLIEKATATPAAAPAVPGQAPAQPVVPPTTNETPVSAPVEEPAVPSDGN